MVLMGIDTARPLDPVAYHANTEDKGYYAHERAKYPPRFTKEEGAKDIFTPHQGTES
jgi:hypothetical protein